MRKFTNTRVSHTEYESGFSFPQYTCDEMLDWYTTRDQDEWGSVVMTDLNGLVVSAVEDAESLSIGPGFNIYEVDWKTVPEDALGRFTFDGKVFTPVTAVVEKTRTKEDIMSDLLKLQEELKAM